MLFIVVNYNIIKQISEASGWKRFIKKTILETLLSS